MRSYIAFLSFALSALGASAQKAPDIRLSTDPPGVTASISPSIAASGASVYVTWHDYRAGDADIYFNRSTDRGATWLANDVQLNTVPAGAATSIGPAIAASGSAVYVVWHEGRTGRTDIYFNRSLDGGATWLPDDVRLDTDPAGAAYSFGQRIAVSGSSVYVTWHDARNAGFGRSDIYFNRSLDGGSTWLSSDVRLDTDPAGAANSEHPRIAASGSSVYVTWIDARNAAQDVFFNRSLDGGATWLPSDVRLDTDPPGTGSSDGAEIAASGSSVFVVWDDGGGAPSGRDVRFNRSLDAGATWLSAATKLNTNPPGSGAATSAHISAAGSAVVVAWQDTRNGAGAPDVYFNRSPDAGDTWLAGDLRLDTDPPGAAASVAPQVAASGAWVHVTWLDSRNGGSDDVYFNRSLDGGTTWLAGDLRLDTDPPGSGASRSARIAASGASAYVTWVDGRSSPSGDIYFNVPFGFQPYGIGTAGSGGLAPRLDSAGSATVGSSPPLDVANGLGGAAGAILFGAGPGSKIALPLLGGTLLVAPALSLPIGLDGVSGVAGAGSTSLPLPIPATETFVGTNLNMQAVLLDSGAPRGVSMTNGIELWIG